MLNLKTFGSTINTPKLSSMLNLKDVWTYSKLEHTIVNKGSMKALQRFIQLEVKEHDCYWAWFKGRDNQDELATWHRIFQRSPSSRLEFCKAMSSLDGCDSMLHDDWLDIPWVIIVHSFCFKPKMVSDRNTRRNMFIIIFLCSLHKGIMEKIKAHVISQKCLFWDKSSSFGNLRIVF